jgi:hypothetical protein
MAVAGCAGATATVEVTAGATVFDPTGTAGVGKVVGSADDAPHAVKNNKPTTIISRTAPKNRPPFKGLEQYKASNSFHFQLIITVLPCSK